MISVKCKLGEVPEDRVFTKYADVVVLNITAHLFFVFIKNVNGLYLLFVHGHMEHEKFQCII
jgi:hypothetical protein